MSVNLPQARELLAVPGVRLGTAAAAIKSAGRDDVVVLVFDAATTVAGVFTQSSFRAAPVQLAESRILAGNIAALIINSGNANAATGAAGLEDASTVCDALAAALDVQRSSIAPFSTGVIGERLPVARILPAVHRAVSQAQADNWGLAASAIMTTDTAPKVFSRTVDVAGTRVTLSGMAKGAGMIRPDMATMLAFVCCDAAVSSECLRNLVRVAADASFNRITIDGDTSTNDSFVLAATGAAGNALIDHAQVSGYVALEGALIELCQQLAQCVVRDGEGATKFVTVRVEGGLSEAECLQVAYTVAESPLVKTALFASDPNWGRLAMAIGRTGIDAMDPTGVNAYFDDVAVMTGGVMDPGYTEAAGAGVMARAEFEIRIELGRGEFAAEIWTSDLSYEYVRINAEYRT